MFCKNCGTELPMSAKFCPKCGIKINNAIIKEEINDSIGIKEDYVLFNNIKDEKRTILNARLKFGEKIVEWIVGLATIWFIYKQIQLAEDYKFIIYVVRYFIFIIPFCFFAEIYHEIFKLMVLRKNQINQKRSNITMIIIKVIYIFFLIIIMNNIINPENNSVGLLKVLFQNNFLKSLIEYLLFIKFEILSLIVLGLCNRYIDKNILGYEEEE